MEMMQIEIKINISKAMTLSGRLGPFRNLINTKITDKPRMGMITQLR
jgi:hypothetical protein